MRRCPHCFPEWLTEGNASCWLHPPKMVYHNPIKNTCSQPTACRQFRDAGCDMM